MKVVFKNTPPNPDHSVEIMLNVEGTNEAFIMNIYNLFMVEMVKLHGPGFHKLLSSSTAEGKIEIAYSHNVSAEIMP